MADKRLCMQDQTTDFLLDRAWHLYLSEKIKP